MRKTVNSLAFASLIGSGLAAMVFVILRWVPFGEYPGDAFFDLAAQTIPILLVALAVEAQARRFDLEETGKRIRIAAVIFLACGETAAIAVAAGLYAPDRGTVASDVLIVITAVGLLGGFFAVIAVALRTPPPATDGIDRQVQPIAEGEPAEAGVSRLEQPQKPRRNRGKIVPALIGALLSMVLLRSTSRGD